MGLYEGVCDACSKRTGDSFFTKFRPAPITQPGGHRVELCPTCALTLLGELIGWRRNRDVQNRAMLPPRQSKTPGLAARAGHRTKGS